MTKQIFKPTEEQTMISLRSSDIVNTLLDEAPAIIDGMIARKATTKRTYKNNVGPFLEYIERNGMNVHSFASFRKNLETLTGVSKATKNAYLMAAKAVLRESVKLRILPVDITSNVPSFKVYRGHKKDGLTRGEVKRVFEYIQTIKRESTRIKLHTMFTLFAYEGLRQMEVQNLQCKDVNIKEGYIRIMRKGQDEKERFFVTTQTLQALKEYILYNKCKEGYIFHTKDNIHQPVTLRAIRKYFTCPKYGIFTKAGIEGKSVHGIRHYNITETLNITNGNLTLTRKRSGHSGLDMLVVYDDERISKSDVARIEAGLQV